MVPLFILIFLAGTALWLSRKRTLFGVSPIALELEKGLPHSPVAPKSKSSGTKRTRNSLGSVWVFAGVTMVIIVLLASTRGQLSRKLISWSSTTTPPPVAAATVAQQAPAVSEGELLV